MGEKVLFCNITGMKNYRGITPYDKPSGWGGYWVGKEGFGHEIYNFKPRNGFVYGYVKPGKGEKIDIFRLGANEKDEKVEGVTVVWVSTHTELGAIIVGWYKNAIVYRNFQEPPKSSRLSYKGDEIWYNIKTSEKNRLLLDEDKRTFKVPRGKHGFGQANIWYGDNNPIYVKNALRYINSGIRKDIKKESKNKILGFYQTDIKKRLKIEARAIEFVTKEYENNGFNVTSIEKENLGYDLKAKKRKLSLKLEVKGREGKEIMAELTPNEYKAMKEYIYSYRVCIVTNCLTLPKLTTFSYENGKWTDDNGNKLTIEKVTGARLSLNK